MTKYPESKQGDLKRQALKKQQARRQDAGTQNPQKPDPKQSSPVNAKSGANQGEGDKQAARRFNAAERGFVDSAKGRAAIASSKTPRSKTEEKELLDAEEEAAKRARENDPEETRDYRKPAR